MLKGCLLPVECMQALCWNYVDCMPGVHESTNVCRTHVKVSRMNVENMLKLRRICVKVVGCMSDVRTSASACRNKLEFQPDVCLNHVELTSKSCRIYVEYMSNLRRPTNLDRMNVGFMTEIDSACDAPPTSLSAASKGAAEF